MPNVELIVGLLVAVIALTTLARQLHIAFPILLVLGGLVLSFIPGIPSVALPPNLVLLIFLPPLLYVEAINLSFRDLLHSIRPVLNLAVGLVLATIVAVAATAYGVMAFPWAVAFVLGTIVAPTDEVAATAIAERLVVPARLVAIIEDESLLNDAVSLVAYNVAVAAVVSGTFSWAAAGIDVVLASLGGIAVGVGVGWIVGQLRRRIDDPPVEITISLLTGYAAYLPANALHLSGVLAVVACGMYVGRQGSRIISPQVRLQGNGMWEIVNFLLNGVLFILVGLQLHSILSTLAAYPTARLLRYAAAVILTVVLLRIVWTFSAAALPHLFSHPGSQSPLAGHGGAGLHLFSRGRAQPAVPLKETAVVAWTGMRGAVSLAAALAIPLTVAGGSRFPDRELIIYLTYAVILSTLVLQGLTLPLLIQRLGIASDPRELREEVAAQLAAAQAGLESLNSSAADGVPADLVDDLRRRLQARSRRFAAEVTEKPSRVQQIEAAQYRRMLRSMLNAERNALIDLRDQGIISDDVLRRVERELDLEEVRWETLGLES